MTSHPTLKGIVRSLSQIQMPRMACEELAEIIHRGMAAANLKVDDEFVRQVSRLSLGLPHYTHLLAQHAAVYAVEQGRSRVVATDMRKSLGRSLEDVS